ncbi:hypothetical protein BC938DRAFT_481950 [Jimgerdemannia flammicorona]|uniref:Amidophosphoribosyltransferase n=1 Tax=Jimgerdemannia flammicorona TaxID=994334 RepID=A0A433QF09_9FUNG|nr:hypothetical protein BC938DRAFT_481950 [Jimgerdemannia flammicorona]
MCGIQAILLADSNGMASPELFEGLGLLQHRGQDAAGIVTCGSKGRLYQCKGNGMVRDVFDQKQLTNLIGSLGVGHVRYPTAGSSSMSEAQPFYVNSPYGIAFAHNGNLINAQELKNFLDFEAHRHINTDSDSELLLNIFANNLQKTGKFRINEEDIFKAIKDLYQQCKGGYACVAMIAGFGIIGFRDPHGIRPIGFARRKSDKGYDYMFASESTTKMFDQVLLQLLWDCYHRRRLFSGGCCDSSYGVKCEAVIITRQKVTRRQLVQVQEIAPCMFEYVYFARPDSIIDGVSVYKARLAMGEALAEQVVRKMGNKMDIDVVIPVPDTSRVAALQVSHKLNILYREGFIKNRYVGRTFIMPGQQTRCVGFFLAYHDPVSHTASNGCPLTGNFLSLTRRKNVRRKLNAMALEFHDKNVLIVDDSIVRGTTSKEIIQMARDAGAKKVYFASCAPAIRYPNVYGIDMPSRHELVAYRRTDDQVAEEIGADLVIYEDLQDLVESVRKFNPSLSQFDTSVFDGKYVTGNVSEEYMAHLEAVRNDKAKAKNDDNSEILGLYNSFLK